MQPAESYLVTASREEMKEWTIILAAAGIEHRVVESVEGWWVLLPAGRLEEARREIAVVREQNKDFKPPVPDLPVEDVEPYPRPVGAWILIAVLLALFAWTGAFNPANPVHLALDNDAVAVKTGQWWRVFTALGMHADAGHLLGNMAFIGMLGFFVCRRLGSGMGSLLIVLGGGLGNTIVSLLAREHYSIGASTASFAALGLLIGAAMLHHVRRSSLRSIWSRAWIPVGVAVALFGWTGVGEPPPEFFGQPGNGEGSRVDVAAHLFGMLSGFVLGAPFGWVGRVALSDRAQALCGVVLILGYAATWHLALRSL